MEEKEEVKLEENQEEVVKNEEIENKAEEKQEEKKVEKEEKIEKPLTDDELYTKIQTEKLLKNQKIKKISMISVLSVVFALAVVIICLASIPLNLKPSFLDNNYVARVYINGNVYSGTLSSEQNATEYNNLRNLIDDTFNQTYFSGLFNGSLIGYNISETPRQTLSSFNSTLQNDNSNDYVRFEFSEPQILRNKDGSAYSSRLDRNVNSFEFDEAYMMLSDEEGSTSITFYFVVKYIRENMTEEDINGLTEYVISMTTVGDTYEIFHHFNPNAED